MKIDIPETVPTKIEFFSATKIYLGIGENKIEMDDKTFTYKGKIIEDVDGVYEAMKEFLKLNI